MERESEYGNIEYKLLINPSHKKEKRLEELISQMAYRLNEGHGECIYIIGISDHGEYIGISNDDFEITLENLKRMAEVNSCTYTILSKKEIEPNKIVAEIYFREFYKNKYIDIKVGIAGNVDSGKSSLIGVLVSGKNDNGRGLSRVSVFNYSHEIKSGRTSSIAHHIMGFDNSGNVVNYENRRDWTEIVHLSSKIISFFDLAGHEKYLRTTILGLSSSYLDLCVIMVGANMGVTRMTREHIFLCVALNIPFVLVISKIDIVKDRQNVLNQTIEDIKKILKIPGIRKVAYKIKSYEDVLLTIKNKENQTLVPMFMISNVTGENIDLLKNYLNLTNKNKAYDFSKTSDVEYHIDTIFQVNGVGTVVGGHLKSGSVKVGDKLYLGPNNKNYEVYTIKSIHVKKTLVDEVSCNSYACFNLKKALKKNIRRGQVLLSNKSQICEIKKFVAQISILRTHSTTIKPGYEPVVHVNSIRQCARIMEINEKITSKNSKEDNILRTGDRAKVTFEFKYNGEYLKEGFKILLAEGKVKIIGKIVELID